MTDFIHKSVLLHETIHSILSNEKLFLNKKPIEQIHIVDATLGGAGHAIHLIEEFHKRSEFKNSFLYLIGIDQDSTAIAVSSKKLENLKAQYSRFDYSLFNCNFEELSEILKNKKIPKIHGLYADFGVSSPQFDTRERGFSFMHEGPLDMRMNQKNTLTAEKILNTYSEADLARIFFEYGEEPKSRLLARAIVSDRKTPELYSENSKVFGEYVKRVLKYGYSRVHPATRVFQALRIEVNSELTAIQTLLSVLPSFMHPFSKAGFISFHSLEDRLVKKTMRLWQERKLGRENPRGGIIPTVEEIAHNPRARSARLRVFDFAG